MQSKHCVRRHKRQARARRFLHPSRHRLSVIGDRVSIAHNTSGPLVLGSTPESEATGRVVSKSYRGEEFANQVRANLGATGDVRLSDTVSEPAANTRTVFIMVRNHRHKDLQPSRWRHRFRLWCKHNGIRLFEHGEIVAGPDETKKPIGVCRLTQEIGTDTDSVRYYALRAPSSVLADLDQWHNWDGWLILVEEKKNPLPGTGSNEFMPKFRKPKSKPAKHRRGLPEMPTYTGKPGCYVPFGGGSSTSLKPCSVPHVNSLYIG